MERLDMAVKFLQLGVTFFFFFFFLIHLFLTGRR